MLLLDDFSGSLTRRLELQWIPQPCGRHMSAEVIGSAAWSSPSQPSRSLNPVHAPLPAFRFKLRFFNVLILILAQVVRYLPEVLRVSPTALSLQHDHPKRHRRLRSGRFCESRSAGSCETGCGADEGAELGTA